jgi:hypothetical protein
MTDGFKPLMAALFAHIKGAVEIPFTASGSADSAVLSNISTFENLLPGLPVFGVGIENGTAISTVDEDAGTITLSAPLTADAIAVDFTTGFLYSAPRLQHWTQTPSQPAFFLRRVGVTDQDLGDGLIAITLECEAWIYCNAGQNPNVSPGEALESLEQLVRASMGPDDGDFSRFTLGGLVHWCRIEGTSDVSSGDQGPQAITRIPIRVTLP